MAFRSLECVLVPEVWSCKSLIHSLGVFIHAGGVQRKDMRANRQDQSN